MKLFRANIWWNSVVPQVLAWVYFFYISLYRVQLPNVADFINLHDVFRNFWHTSGPFFLALVFLSSFGYQLNDFCDIESDKLTGKNNSIAQYPVLVRYLVLMFTFIMAMGSWAWQIRRFGGQHELVATGLFVFQIVLLVLYSVKPFRLKERGLWGVVADALYGHLNPALITIFAYKVHLIFSIQFGAWGTIMLIAVGCLWFTKGLRNILLHQTEDRKKDRQAGIKTYVATHSALGVINFINRYLLRIEIALFMVFWLVVSYLVPPFILSPLLFALFSYFKFSGWKLAYLPKRQLKFKFLHFLNDYYEGWFPVTMLLIFTFYNHWAAILLILHLVLFPGFIINLYNGIKTIRENFKTEEDY